MSIRMFGAVVASSYKARRRQGTGTVPSFVSSPAINGQPVVGVPVSFTSGTVAGIPTPALTQQWLRDGANISGATNLTYTPVLADVGTTLSVRQTATNVNGAANSTSAGVVVASAPAFTAAPVILGTPTVGVPVAYTQGTVTGTPTPSRTRQWLLDGNPIAGATASTYTPVPGDEGSGRLSVRETATNVAGSANSTSTAVNVAPAAPGASVTTFTLTRATGGTGVPFALGQVFKRGDVPAGQGLTLNTTTAQVTPISVWDDGSVKHALVAGTATLSANTPLTVTVSHGSGTSGTTLVEADLIAAGPTASVSYGAYGTVNLASLLGTSALVLTEHAGPRYAAFQYVANFPSDSTVRAVFYVQLWAGGSYRVRVAVETGTAPMSGAAKTGTAVVTVAGATLNNSAVSMRAGTRWDVVGATFTLPTALHNAAYLRASKLVPNYGYTGASASTLNALNQAYAPMDGMSWNPNMGDPAYHPAIGLLPHWDALYCTTGDARALASSVEHGRAFGVYGIFYRDTATRRMPKFSDYPTTYAGNESLGSTYVWEFAHHPNAGYLPWLLTGERFHLETLQANAWACYITNNNNPSEAAGNAAYQNANRVVTSQTRGRAWRFRTYAAVAAVSPTGDAVATDCRSNVAANLSRWKTAHVDVNTPSTGLIGIYDDKDLGTTGFQHSIFESLFLTASLGFTWDIDPGLNESQKAQHLLVRDFTYRVPVGLLGRGQAQGEYSYRRAPGPYRMVIGSGATTSTLYSTWGQIETATWGADGLASTDGLAILGNPVSGYADDASADSFPTGNWGHVAGAISYAVSHGYYGAQAAYDRLTGASNWASNAAKFNDYPQYGLAPRTLSLPYSLPAAGAAVAIGTNTATDIKPASLTAFNWAYSIFNGYGCGTFMEDFSEVGAYVVASNGSHGAPSSPDAAVFDLLDATWKRVDDSLGAPDWNADFVDADTNGAPWFEINGYPESPGGSHLYGTVQQIQRKYGGGPKGSYMKMGQWALTDDVAIFGGGIHAMRLDTGAWARVNGQSGLLIGENAVEGMAAQDPDTGRWFFARFGHHVDPYIQYLDPVDMVLKSTPTYGWPPGDTDNSNYGTMFVDRRHRLLIIHRSLTRMLALQLDNIAAGWTRLVESNEGARPSAPNRLHYYPPTGAYYTRLNASGQTLTKLTPPATNPLTNAWAWDTVTVTGATLPNFTTTGSNDGRRHYGTFFYVPRLNCFAWISGESSQVILCKPAS